MKTIAVIFGGRSTEHDVSVVTAIASIIKPLEATRQYDIEPIYIAKDGRWFWDKKLKDISIYQDGSIDEFMRKAPGVQLQLGGGLTLVKSSQFAGRKAYKKIDIVFPAMHGTHGEDGELMGLLEMAGVPYVGCGPTAGAVAMDKVLAKQVAESDGIDVAKYIHLYRDSFAQRPAEIIKEIEAALKYPLFVKPAHLGSSIGISRARDRAELQNAIEVAAHYDDKVLVEEEVQNLIEVTLPIIGNQDLRPAFLERPLTKADDFFDFETKYMNGGKKGGQKSGQKGAQGYSEIPAKLDDKLYKKAEQTGLKTYRALGCKGIARIDMLINSKTGVTYFNECNPLPGGLYAHNWRAAGLSNIDLVEELIHLAEQDFKNKERSVTSFNTNYLKQF